MRKQLSIAFLIIPFLGFNQINMDQHQLSAQGDFDQSYQMSISWTIGDFVAETVVLDQQSMTQGFHQPDKVVETNSDSKISVTLDLVDMEIFPNPSNGILNVRINNVDEPLFFEILDAKGTLLFSMSSADPILEIDLNPFVDGIYFLRVSNSKRSHSTISKVVKL